MRILKQFKYNRFHSRKTRISLFSGFFCTFLILLLLLAPVFRLTAEETSEKAKKLREELNARIEELTQQIEKYRGTIQEIQGQAQSLEREISLLDNQIKRYELEIERMALIVQETESEIDETDNHIKELEQQSENEKVILGELIREIYKYDEVSILEIILTQDNFSDFFFEIQSLENLQLGIQKSLEEIRKLKKELEIKKEELEEKRNEMIGLKAVQETQKYSIQKKKNQRKELLEETRGQEYLYQRLVKNKQKDANSIRSQLYILQGMGGSLKFEDALRYAERALSLTGVRPAFLLAVLSQESGWGVNVGTGTWREDMSPRQHSAYLVICEKLGFDPDMMPVSKRAWYGWGGAMGPAQFIPTTWLGYESRVAALTGNNPPNPWDMEDAFIASALYLANAGATSHAYTAEHRAYMIYLAGGNWQKPSLQFYGDRVMELAATLQEQIDIINQQ